MYSFEKKSSSLGSISSALVLPVSRGRHGKLVDNFSHESDVTSLQDPFTSRPYKTPFYFYYCVPRKIRRVILPKTMCTRIFLSRPSWRPVLQFSQRVISLGFPYTRLSSGTSAGTLAVSAGPYINYRVEAGTKNEPELIKHPRTRSAAARQVSNTHERDLVTNQNV